MDYRTLDPATTPRGIRNNNPGNLKPTDNWQGAVGNDGTFIIFADSVWGLRAIARAITTMIGKGYNTIATLIPEWSATDQQAYINNVATATGIAPTDPLQPDQATLHGIVRAIVDQENGSVPGETYVSDEDIDTGINMAQSGLSTLPAAAIVYAQANPAEVIMIALITGITLYYLFGDNKRSQYE